MIFAVDIGNTNIVLGGMEGMDIKFMSRITTDKLKTDTEYAVTLHGLFEFEKVDPTAFAGAIISSVVPQLTSTFAKAVKRITGINPLIIGAGLKTGVNIMLDDPGEAGSDLVAAAAAAIKLYEPPLIIIDMGTATTITVVDKNGVFRGGAIAPGVVLGLSALTSRTSQLPAIPIEAPDHTIGTNTIDCMKSGAALGAAAMIDGMIDRMEEELGYKATAVATGGIASSIIPLCKREIILNDDLLLYGLSVIYEKNRR